MAPEPRRIVVHFCLAASIALACAMACVALWPKAQDAAALLWAQDDPAKLAELQTAHLAKTDPAAIERQIGEALDADDSDLAKSFKTLATEHNVAVSPEATARVDAAVARDASAGHLAKRFVTGFVTGDASDVASFSGTVAGDLFVFGDVRDVIRESKHLAFGEETDHLVLGLAATGIAVTAATYVSVGGALPVRAGLTLVKDARKVGRLGAGLTEWTARATRGVVDSAALSEAVKAGSVMRPGRTISAVKAAYRAEKAGALVRVAKDVGRISEKAGVRGAMDTLRVAEGPKDLARAARLAETKGGQTRALVKLFGRGALLLTAGAWSLMMWLLWAVSALIGLVCAIKSMSENLARAIFRRNKARRIRKVLAQSPGLSLETALVSSFRSS